MRFGKKELHISRLMAALLVVAMTLAFAPQVQATLISGSCGSRITWSINGGTLQITGSGAMTDYSYTDLAPWYDYRETITAISVTDGITKVGNFAFFELKQIKAVCLPDSVTEIGEFAFYGCANMEMAYVGATLEKLGDSAFEQCRSLKAIQLPNTVLSIGQMAFYSCKSLLSITVPSSVYVMGGRVFAYCSGLRSAVILASIGQLPYWTFYGCHNLTNITLSSAITEVGVQAFENCESLTDARYGGAGAAAEGLQQQIQTVIPGLDNFHPEQNVTKEPEADYTSTETQEKNGQTVTVQTDYSVGHNGNIEVQTAKKPTGTDVQISGVLNNEAGWQDLAEKVNTAVNAKPDKLQVEVYLQNDGTVLGKDIGRFAGQDVIITIHTQQGAVWRFMGKDISAKELKERYFLAYTITPIETPTKAQQKVIGGGYAYAVVFDDSVDFPVSVDLRVGKQNNIASFFVPEGSNKYQQIQRVIVDSRSVATFNLLDIQADVEYLVGIGVPAQSADPSQNDYVVPGYDADVPVEYIDMEKYAIAGLKSSWGLDISQVTWILVAVMVGSVIVVGVVVGIMNKRRLKKGYIPDYDDEEETQE